MLWRIYEDQINSWLRHPGKSALLLYGVRQSGKSTLIETLVPRAGLNLVEINLKMHPDIASRLEKANSPEEVIDIIRFNSGGVSFIPGKTVIFLDEIEKAPNTITFIKDLVNKTDYLYAMSGSLLGVEINSIDDWPVGSLNEIHVYPMGFYEFARALTSIDESIIDKLRHAYIAEEKIDDGIHETLIELFHRYLIVGGMPEVVASYAQSHQTSAQDAIFDKILKNYTEDFSQYELSKKLHLTRIYDALPAYLGQENKRFPGNFLGRAKSFASLEDDFLWLSKSGVALECTRVSEPLIPLLANIDETFKKLYLSDVGLLCYRYGTPARNAIIDHDSSFNRGALFENAVAQELALLGYPLFYFSQRHHGEIEFLIETANAVLPIEVKSGSSYKTHASLDYVLDNPRYGLKKAIVFSEHNVEKKDRVTYYPIYLMPFLKENCFQLKEDIFPDLSLLAKKSGK
ncbi:MAG: AAA family ATPase [Bacilli bacterium]|jgi:predicted AAA+ superfamily ATPase|nr:AAA family ATPase [Bacilli bacterium]